MTSLATEVFDLGRRVSWLRVAVFALAGLTVELTSLPVYENVPWISIVIGLVLLALGLAMLQGIRPVESLDEKEFNPKAVIYVAPPFRPRRVAPPTPPRDCPGAPGG